MKRWFQFSLRTLLASALVLPAAGYWILRSKQAASAAQDYIAVASAYDGHTVKFEQVYDCSVRLRDAELAVPFSNRRDIMVRYLNRLAHLEERAKSVMMRPTRRDSRGVLSFDVSMTRILALSGEREAVEAELGVKADSAGAGVADTGD